MVLSTDDWPDFFLLRSSRISLLALAFPSPRIWLLRLSQLLFLLFMATTGVRPSSSFFFFFFS